MALDQTPAGDPNAKARNIRNAKKGCGGCLAVFVGLMVLAAACGGRSTTSTSAAGSNPPPATPAPTAATEAPSNTPTPQSTYTPPAPAPAHTTQAPPAGATHPASSCYPQTNGRKCYQPGEYCRSSDHGASGIDGEGAAIRCEDNNGWRWERV
ncbi:hypothetical protein ACIQWA_02730 [Kitasatospora sp. NPDC098652]|uniref:hypothetical protein n=1 Tax=Kitasatospora sp. NPDC098652 TaxID=3364095 RepID=UPI003821A4B0